jgi:hypothetical protein
VLQPVKAISGKADPRLYVRVCFNICVDDKMNIYATDCDKNNVLKINDKWEFEKRFAKKGRGPGDLYSPESIICSGNNIIVDDMSGYSFFNTDGKYLHRFRKFLPYMTFTADSKFVYTYLPRAKDVITIFDHRGNKIRSFGERYKILKPKKMSYGMFVKIYRAKIIITKKYIYLLYYAPGLIVQYDKKGNFVRNIWIKYNDDFLDGIQKGLRRIIFKKGGYYKGYKKIIGKGVSIYHTVIRSAFYYKGKIYLLLEERLYFINNEMFFKGMIMRYDEETLRSEKKYVFYDIFCDKYGKDSFMQYNWGGLQFSVKKRDDKEYFFIPIIDRSEKYGDIYIGVYKTK